MILETIENKLKELDSNVFYGVVDDSMRETAWNYTVFNRRNLKSSTNKNGYNTVFSVHIIRENYIPEGLEEDFIEKMLEIEGVRTASDGQYDYVMKPNTNIVVEMFSIDFVRARKKVI